MERQYRFFTRVAILAALCAVGSMPLAADEMATATYSVSALPSATWNYTITVNDTGTTPIGTFWFSWLPGEGFMQTAPISAVAPAGWVATTTNGTRMGDGFSERWVDNAGALMPGQSATFSFVSATTPGEIAGNSPFYGGGIPELTSDVYMGAPSMGADAPLVVTPGPSSVPEPSSVVLILTGVVLLIVKSRWSPRLRRQ